MGGGWYEFDRTCFCVFVNSPLSLLQGISVHVRDACEAGYGRNCLWVR